MSMTDLDKFDKAILYNLYNYLYGKISRTIKSNKLCDKKVGSSLVAFVSKFPRNTDLYKLMTTKFGEV